MRGPDQTETESFADSFAGKLQATRTLQGIDARMLGPAPPPLAKLRGKYRYHILLHTAEPEPLNRLIVRTVPTSNRRKIFNTSSISIPWIRSKASVALNRVA